MASPRPTIFLFDIDGTLIDGGGAGRRAMEDAFDARVPGGRAAMATVRFAGMTDRAIVRAGLDAAPETSDVPEHERDVVIDAVLAEYLERLPAMIAEARHAYRVHPGVDAALTAAAGTGGALGLGTGNLRRGGQLKLEPVALWERFAFGGFGSDAEDRAQLLAVGAERGGEQLAVAPEQARVLVIGDTPRDIAAALAIGAQCLAVATGGYDVPTLAACNPTYVVPTLEHPDAIAAIVA